MLSGFVLPSESVSQTPCFIPQSRDLTFLQEAVNRELNMLFSGGYFGSTLGSLFFFSLEN